MALEIIQSRKDRRKKGNVGNTRALGRHHNTWVMDSTCIMERCVSCGCSRTKRKAELFLKRESEQQMCQWGKSSIRCQDISGHHSRIPQDWTWTSPDQGLEKQQETWVSESTASKWVSSHMSIGQRRALWRKNEKKKRRKLPTPNTFPVLWEQRNKYFLCKPWSTLKQSYKNFGKVLEELEKDTKHPNGRFTCVG